MTNERALIEFVTEPALVRLEDARRRPARRSSTARRCGTGDPPLELLLVEIRFDTGTHETYQLLADGASSTRSPSPDSATRARAPDPARARRSRRARGRSSSSPSAGLAGVGRRRAREPGRSTPSSRTRRSCFDDELILKVFRRLEAGHQPRARAAALPHRARLRAHRAARRLVRVRRRARWTRRSGILQRFVPDGR